MVCLSSKMDPLVDAILGSTKKEIKEEVENDCSRETYDLASVGHSRELSGEPSLEVQSVILFFLEPGLGPV